MLQQKLARYSIILASGSPRRQQFLKDLHIPFTIQLKPIEEVYPLHLMGHEITDYLSNLKATPFTNLQPNELLITSDTIVWFEGEALGKPKNSKDAIAMLTRLSGKTHQVITSVSIKNPAFQKLIHDTTSVTFKELTFSEITHYVTKYQPLDKAGSYGIQEWIGFIGVEKIEGSYFNVMGLPVHKLYKELMNLDADASNNMLIFEV